MQPDYKLKLIAPAYLELEAHDGSSKTMVDVMEAWRFLEDANKKPNQEARWKSIRCYLAEKMKVQPELIAESTAWEFHDVIVKLGQVCREQHRKNLDSIVSSQQPIPESQQTSRTGQSS